MNNTKFCPIQTCTRKTPAEQLCEACKEHRKLLRKKHYDKLRLNPERVQNYKVRKRKEYHTNRLPKLAVAAKSRRNGGRFSSAKNAASRRGLSFVLTREQFQSLIERPCFYCKDAFNAKSQTCMGLDRIDNSKGYEVSNVLPCCTACNKLRGEFFSVEETKVAVNAILAYRNHSHLPRAEAG